MVHKAFQYAFFHKYTSNMATRGFMLSSVTSQWPMYTVYTKPV